MKISIPTIGSRGDVQPFIALAQGLVRAGHTVTVASHPIMKPLVVSYGVTFAPIGPDIDLSLEVAAIRNKAPNAVMGLIKAMRFGFEMLERSHDDILVQCQDADLVVVPSAIAAGKNEAELLNLPYLSVSLMPWAIPWDDPERSIFKRIVYGTIDGLVNLITTRPLNGIRKGLGLRPVGAEGFTLPRLNLVPISPIVYPSNPLWERRHRIVGYWFVEEPRAWKPPEDLISFLNEGDPPILVSLGAMSLEDGEALESAALFVEAIKQTGVRAIIQGWEAGIRQLILPPNIFPTGSLPHSWLLPWCAGVVHHGGFGTTSAGLRAGVPAFVIPHIADQFYWGQRVHELGVGPKPIQRRKLDKQGLVSALDELVQDKSFRSCAESLGVQIRAENGIENAVRVIEETFG